MKVMLVVPKFTAAPGDFYHFPLGLAYISSALKNAGHDVHCLNCNHSTEDPVEMVTQAVRTFDPDIVTTGGLSPFMPLIKDIFIGARKAKPSVINIAGGGVLSSDPEAGPLVMDIDSGVIGEGEETIVDLVDAYQRDRDLKDVKGIVFKDRDDRVIRTLARPAIMDLASIAWPDYECLDFASIVGLQRSTDAYFFHTKDQPRAIDMITSRSCPYRCTFCFHPTGKVYRERPLDDFFAELDSVVARYNVNMVALVDELFSLKKARLLEFCERIEPYGLEWMVQLHTNCADPHVLDAMKRAGCSYISYGVESMSQDILISMQKKSKKSKIETVLNNTWDRKIGIQANLIFGDTNETLMTANETMAWWAENTRYMVNTNRLQVYPGSPDYIEAVRDGLITDRVGYINSQFVDLNISKMNEEDLSILATKVWTCQSGLLNIVEASVFETEPLPDPARGHLYHVVWDCPHCAHHNDYHNVVLEGDYCNELRLRLTCRGCLARCDIPNELRVRFEDQPLKPELDAQMREVRALIAADRRGETAEILHELIARAPWYWPAQIELGRFYASVGAGPSAVRHLGAAIQLNPYEAECQIAYAERMVEERAIGLAKLHYQQAGKLDPGNLDVLLALRELEAGPWSEEEKATFFISYSDEPPPQRLKSTVQVCGPRRRDEIEFPDIAKLEADTQELLVAAE